jgi:hypothetical protein
MSYRGGRRRRRTGEGWLQGHRSWLEALQLLGLVLLLGWNIYLAFRFDKDLKSVEVEQGRLTTQQISLETRLRERELASAIQGRIKSSSQLHLYCQRERGIYLVVYSQEIENSSDTDVTIAWQVIESHLGTMAVRNGAEPKGQIVMVNDPPVLALKVPTDGAVNWQAFGSVAYVLEGRPYDDIRKAMSSFKPIPGGALKVLRKGDRSHSRVTFLVRGQPDQWVGVSHSFGIDKVLRTDAHFHDRRIARLRDCARTKSGKAMEAAPSVY